MLEQIKALTSLSGVSGDESAVREYILREIKDCCEAKTDPLGNLLVFKKGKNRSVKKLMLDAHMDEVGLIVSGITESGFLKFRTVGGIETGSLMFRQVKIGDRVGVISGKPVHLLKGEERKKLPPQESLYIDIGVSSKQEALELVSPGDRATFLSDFFRMGDRIAAKALDDRVGCAILLSLLKKESEYDFYASFSVQEEVGLRGARVAAYSVDPEAAIVLEATTAADIDGVPESESVCRLGKGPAVSFMDKGAVYDRAYYQAALRSGIPCQPKAAVAGGNNSGAIHVSRKGVRTLAVSVPCRYLHSPVGMVDMKDVENAEKLARTMINGICGGGIA